MKNFKLIVMVFCLQIAGVHAQLLAGTLDVQGMPSFIQSFSDTVQEAGLDDSNTGFETVFDATIIGYKLNPTTITIPLVGDLTTSSEDVCAINVFRYQVYMHTVNAPVDLILQAKSITSSGVAVPPLGTILYDNLPIKPLGPRDLTTQAGDGDGYITIPDDSQNAIKVFEFVGCRSDIPIQFKVKPSALTPAPPYDNFLIYYTVVGSLL